MAGHRKLIFLLQTIVQWTHDSTQQTDYQVFWDKQKKVVSGDIDFTLKLSAPRSMALAWPSIHLLSRWCLSTWYDYHGVCHGPRNFGWSCHHHSKCPHICLACTQCRQNNFWSLTDLELQVLFLQNLMKGSWLKTMNKSNTHSLDIIFGHSWRISVITYGT